MSFSHSASNCMKSLMIICSKPPKVMSKQCSGAISISLVCGIKFFVCYSLVISFAYLIYHFTNVPTKLYVFCISLAQSQHANIKTSIRKVLF